MGLERQFRLGMLVLAAVSVAAGLSYALGGKQAPAGQKLAEDALVDEGDSADAPNEEGRTPEGNAAWEGKNIRVLIMGDGFQDEAHPKIVVSADAGLTVAHGETAETYGEKEKVKIKPDCDWFSQGNLYIKAKKGKIKIESLKRGEASPAYAGTLELWATAEGIVVVNDLPVESYLRGVVPSEMPASYEMEALKAQAVCARSYAYRQMEEYAYPEYKAHVNDSTDYQVYNLSERAKSCSAAVKATKGETVQYQGKTVATYYFSTSCGRTTTMEAWGTKPSEANAYLQSVEVKGEQGDYEKDLPWYRWSAEIPADLLSDLVGLNTGKDLGTVTQVEVTKRGPGDVAVEVLITGEKGSASVKTENKIRKAFGGGGYQIRLQDGSETDSRPLLPSAFFQVEKQDGCFVFSGGGFGHGIGMSQTGANEMAKQGKGYKEILGLFYQGIEVK